jgi:hypothetical protein
MALGAIISTSEASPSEHHHEQVRFGSLTPTSAARVFPARPLKADVRPFSRYLTG